MMVVEHLSSQAAARPSHSPRVRPHLHDATYNRQSGGSSSADGVQQRLSRTQLLERYKLHGITEVEVVKDADGKVAPGLGVGNDVLAVVGRELALILIPQPIRRHVVRGGL